MPRVGGGRHEQDLANRWDVHRHRFGVATLVHFHPQGQFCADGQRYVGAGPIAYLNGSVFLYRRSGFRYLFIMPSRGSKE